MKNKDIVEKIIKEFEQLKISVNDGLRNLKLEQPGIKLMLKTFYEELLNRENDLKLAKEILDTKE